MRISDVSAFSFDCLELAIHCRLFFEYLTVVLNDYLTKYKSPGHLATDRCNMIPIVASENQHPCPGAPTSASSTWGGAVTEVFGAVITAYRNDPAVREMGQASSLGCLVLTSLRTPRLERGGMISDFLCHATMQGSPCPRIPRRLASQD